jgi:beta-glucosidase-like glycosyl hydrolase/CubicO group peptidase (beta-lactamase class C family)
MNRPTLFTLAALGLGLIMCQSTPPPPPDPNNMQISDKDLDTSAAYRQRMEAWVETKFKTLSDDQKIGQLIMIAAYPEKGEADKQRVLNAIQQHHVGGIIIFQGSPVQSVNLLNTLQAKSALPLLVSVDGEWGLSMRWDSTVFYPRHLTLGAIRDNQTVYNFGKQLAQEFKRAGVHINFAPVVDVNNNPNNPVIGDRSFGDDLKNVSEKAAAYMQGLQDNGILACAKHFPGHGDTDVDSHKDLPILSHSMERLENLELVPFKHLIQKQVAAVMVAHLQIPAIDNTPHTPMTLSYKGITGILKEKLQYKGLIITDALNMSGVTKHHAHGETDLLALKAGNDILLMTQDLPAAFAKIRQAIKTGELKWEDLNERVKKVLRAKFMAGLDNYQPANLKNLTQDLNSTSAKAMKEQILASALTLVKNEQKALPLSALGEIATLSIGTSTKTVFQTELEKFGVVHHLHAGHSIVGKQADKYLELSKYKTVIVGINHITKNPLDRHNISQSVEELVAKLAAKTKVIVVLFGNPYAAQYFENIPNLVVAYDDDRQTQTLCAQAMVGALPLNGILPISTGKTLKAGMGEQIPATRMAYASSPEVLGFNPTILKKIDNVAKEMITDKASAGCQVLVAKNGKIAFHKTYGHHTYDRSRATRPDDVYDLASVTKIASATLSLMRLVEEKKIDLDKPLSFYLPELLANSNKSDITIRQILAHHAGLKAWIPFYKNTLDTLKQPSTAFYRTSEQAGFNLRVTDKLFFANGALDTIVWKAIADAPQRENKNYEYSDMGFILFTKLVEKVSGQTLDKYVSENFYKPMGLTQIGYNPLQNGIPKNRVVPTEQDNYFRYSTIQGYVHDMGAAMMGGVSGHAGLFATATDLAAVMQLLVDEGEYLGKRYLRPETVRLFIAPFNSSSRRGLGFDKKELGSNSKTANVAYQASERTFGHLGFTGICAWADPESKLVYIFLSNRTLPNMENNKLNGRNIRPRIHELIYDALVK